MIGSRVSGTALVLFAASLAACEGRAHSSASQTSSSSKARRGPAIEILDLTAGAPEIDRSSLLDFAPKHRNFATLLRTADDVVRNKDARGVLVRFGSAPIGMARSEELADTIDTLRAKFPVYCQADGYSNATMMAAAHCSKIYVSPAGAVDAVGIAAQIVYMRKLLQDELHISIDILQVGKFKGAEEPLTRDGPSDEARASLESTLGDMRASWIDTVVKGRAGANGIAAAIEDGPYSPAMAKDRGLVDEIGYADDALDALKKETNAERDQVVFGPNAVEKPEDLGDIVRTIAGEENVAPIALVRAVGSISMTSGNKLFGNDEGIAEHDLDRVLEKIEANDDVKVLVLRIDSPGGSALASDLIWHHLMKVRAKKPIVVSVGEMAASGGYYLASTGSVIFADRTSIVGSIGVVGGKVAINGALEQIGVHAETFPANTKDPRAKARAAAESPLLEWDDATRGRILESMKAIYDLFLARVSEGRSTEGRTISVAKIAESAEGRIFSGRDGKARALVDEIGGLEAAIAKARSMANLPADARVIAYGGRNGLLDLLGASGGDDGDEARTPAMSDARAATMDLLFSAAPELATCASSVESLLRGERVLVAMPFGAVVR